METIVFDNGFKYVGLQSSLENFSQIPPLVDDTSCNDYGTAPDQN